MRVPGATPQLSANYWRDAPGTGHINLKNALVAPSRAYCLILCDAHAFSPAVVNGSINFRDEGHTDRAMVHDLLHAVPPTIRFVASLFFNGQTCALCADAAQGVCSDTLDAWVSLRGWPGIGQATAGGKSAHRSLGDARVACRVCPLRIDGSGVCNIWP